MTGSVEVRGEGTVNDSVVLREVTDDDLPILFEQQRDPVANRMAAFIARDPDDRDAFQAHWTKIRGDEGITIRTILFEGRVAGHVAKWVNELGKPEVTYWIGREYWGRGIATEALSQLVRQVKERPLYGRAANDNVASIRVLEKCGFSRTGSDRSFAMGRGEEIEETILELR